MANPAPCQACLETPDAEFCITNRLGVPWPFEQAVVNVCVPCLINLGITMGQALQEAIAAMEAEATPGALEQVEADEGVVKPAPPPRKRAPRKAKKAPALAVVPAPAQEGAPPDDDR